MKINCFKYLVVSFVLAWASTCYAIIEDYANDHVQFNSIYPQGEFHNKWLSYLGSGNSAMIECRDEGKEDTNLKLEI